MTEFVIKQLRPNGIGGNAKGADGMGDDAKNNGRLFQFGTLDTLGPNKVHAEVLGSVAFGKEILIVLDAVRKGGIGLIVTFQKAGFEVVILNDKQNGDVAQDKHQEVLCHGGKQGCDGENGQ
jgi:hypothetical protein